MSTVNTLNSTLAAGSTTASGTKTAGLMGKEDFLKLLVAQLKHQDPLNPQDPTQFTAQLAQFSQLEQAIDTNKNLTALAGMSTDMERMSALGMIGKPVTVEASGFALDGTGGATLGCRLDSAAASATLAVQDANGRTVATVPVTSLGAGEHFVAWNGTDASGNTLPAGNYSLSVVAKDKDDKLLSATALLKTTATGVDMGSDGNQVVTALGSYALAKVTQVGG